VNRADKMLEVLRDGRPHTRRDLFERCGFFLTNNAAAELRARGYDVRQSRARVDGVIVYSYALHGSLAQPDDSLLPQATTVDTPHGLSGSASEQRLFT